MNPLSFFRRRRHDADLAREIAAHIEAERAEYIARGFNPEEANRRARIKFGSERRVHEDLWQQNSFAPFENITRDLCYALRTLARTPGFTVTAILMMALGIGATTALFTVVRSVLLNPLPYPQSSRLVELYEDQGDTGQHYHYIPVTAGSVAQWQRAAQGSAEIAIVCPWMTYDVSANGSQLPESVHAGWVSWNFFRVLSVTPALGRAFLASDDQPSAAATVILSNAFWKRRFGTDPNIIGKSVYLDAKPYTIIGVMPPSFVFPDPKTQFWTAANHEGSHALMTTFEDHRFWAIARLAHGTTLSGLLSQLDIVQKQIKLSHPAPSVGSLVVGNTLLDATVEDFKTPLYALLAATLCVLLIACLNVANLLVARSAARQKDLAIRAALGGTRWRLIREHVTESFVLSIAGGASGLLLAWAALAGLQYSHIDIARAQEIQLGWWTLAFVIVISAITGIAAGLIPSFSLQVGRLPETLQSSSRSHSGGSGRPRLRKALLTVEVSLTVMLLLGAGLLLKSYRQLRTRDLGCAIDNVLTMDFSLPDARYKEPAQKVAFFEQLLAKVRALPGVQAAGLSTALPGMGWEGDDNIAILEHPPLPKGAGLDTLRRSVDPYYFAAMRIPLLRGRYFRDDERLDHGRTVIIDQSTAEQFFPGEDPLGRHIKLDDADDKQSYEVVGIVGKSRWMVSQPPMPTYYLPLFNGRGGDAVLAVRGNSNVDVESLAVPIQKIFGQLDPDLPVADVLTMRQNIGVATLQDQFNSILVLVFAIIALVLAAVGLYGVLSYLVTQRTTEFGIRMALGAQRTEVVRVTLADGLAPVLIGLVVGLVGGVALIQLVRSMLYGMSPFDWSVFATVVLIITITATLASIFPAWRATRLDPSQALRAE
jgi:putative ABC transport system permease protein